MRSKCSSRRGSALVLATISLLLLMALSAVLLSAVSAEASTLEQERVLTRLREAAEIGVGFRLLALNAGEDASDVRGYALPGGDSVYVSLLSHSDTLATISVLARRGAIESELYARLERPRIALFPQAITSRTRTELEHDTRVDPSFDSRIGTPLTSFVGPARIHSGESVLVGHSSFVNGGIDASIEIELDGGSSVSGMLRAPLLKAVATQAAVLELSEPRPVELPSWDAEILRIRDEAAALAVSSLARTLGASETLVVGPGVHSYTELIAPDDSRLELIGPTTLIVEQLTLTDDATLYAEGDVTLIVEPGGIFETRMDAEIELPDRGDGWADAHIEVYARGDVFINENGNVGGTPPRPFDFQLWLAAGGDARLEGVVYGAVYNPGGTVSVDDRDSFYGGLVGDEVTIEWQSDTAHDAALLDELTTHSRFWIVTALSGFDDPLEATP